MMPRMGDGSWPHAEADDHSDSLMKPFLRPSANWLFASILVTVVLDHVHAIIALMFDFVPELSRQLH